VKNKIIDEPERRFTVMKTMMKKVFLGALVAVLVLAAFPLANVYAAGSYDPSTPPRDGRVSNERLEKIWARELKAYERMGKLFDGSAAAIAHAQALITKAGEKGKDVSAVQAALDALQAAISDVRPTYESIKGTVNSHQGFDDAGKVTDADKARETVKDMRAKLKEVRDTLGPAVKAFRDAVKAFRQANKPPASSPDQR
jgi:hypothetical protein